MQTLDDKINTHFTGLVVRKDLVKTVKGNAIVPSYVLEYLLGQYCASNDEATIQTGIETVKDILRKHYVHRNEANFKRSEIARLGRMKIIDRVEVDFNATKDVHEAKFENLGISKVLIDAETVRNNPKLLVGGVWCIADVEYSLSEDKSICPWNLESLKPVQLSNLDFESFVETRKQFTTDEWIDTLMQSIGFNPEFFGTRNKLAQLVRLIPFCERNFNLIELGPKGTGKSHLYSEFSPHGTLVSGGEATLAKLFINNTTNKIGLVGYWDVVALDEFAGKKKKPDLKLIDTLKNYMANKSFNRGTGPQGAEASMVMIGNTSHSVPYMLKHNDLFNDLPESYRNSDGQALLDRIHHFIPGWEMDNLRNELFTDGYGFVVDYLAEVLKSLRGHDYSDQYSAHFTLSSDISTRDRDGINKTFSGLMKIIFPHREATKDEIEELLRYSIEGRRRVKDQLMRIDATYSAVDFSYTDSGGVSKQVTTLEETQYPQYYSKGHTDAPQPESGEPELELPASENPAAAPAPQEPELKTGEHLTVPENALGYSYEKLFARHLKGATQITIHDPYIRAFWQRKNMMELLKIIHGITPDGDQTEVKLITKSDQFKCVEQDQDLAKMVETFTGSRLSFSFEYDDSESFHARSITTDTGWKISIDRGLDIYQRYDITPFSLANSVQEERLCKAFEVTYLKQD